jgi:hypothetical protein
MRKMMLLATIVIVGLPATRVKGAGVDFSGNWVLTKRIPNPLGAPVPNVSLIIRQNGIDLEVTQHIADREKTVESHYTLDGAENINTESNAAGPVAVRSKSRWNSSTLVLEGSRTFEGPKKTETTQWKTEYLLSDAGAVLTLSTTIKTPFGEVVVSEVFSRK